MKRKGFKGILLLLSMLFALTGCSVSEATQHGMAVDTIQAEDVLLRVDFLNVGQADCALLSTNGHYMVIDGGNNGDADTILSYLEGQGVEKLDAVVGTHPHEVLRGAGNINGIAICIRCSGSLRCHLIGHGKRTAGGGDAVDIGCYREGGNLRIHQHSAVIRH